MLRFRRLLCNETYDYGYGEQRYEFNDVMHPGRSPYYYYDYDGYIYSYAFSGSRCPGGSVPGGAGGPTGNGVGTSSITAGEPGFGNYASVDMDALLAEQNPKPPEPSIPAPKYSGGSGGISGVSTSTVSISSAFFSGMWSGMHNALDFAGLIPGVGEIADGTNAAIYWWEGDNINAGISAAAVVPFAGWFATGGKALKKGAEAVTEAVAEQGVKHAADAVAAGKTAVKEGTENVAKNVPKKTLRERMVESGNAPPKDMPRPQAHHDLPQVHRDKFARAGIDIDSPEYGRWVSGSPEGLHQNWSAAFNAEWDNFFNQYSKPTKEEILEQMNKLRNNTNFQ